MFNRNYDWIIAALLVIALNGCAETKLAIHSVKRITNIVKEKPVPIYKIGKPYQIDGIWYYPKEDYQYDETGIASWYGRKFHGRKTANGEIYDMNAVTAAHKTLPMPSYARVTNLENGRSLVLRINDRGPFARSRIIDLSRRSAQLLGFQRQGTAKVRVQILASKSRALKANLKGQEEIRQIGSPITVKRIPKASVATESLPLIPGSKVSAPKTITPRSISENNEMKNRKRQAPPDEQLTGNIVVKPVEETNIFVQAGAFKLYENANKVQAHLSNVGPVTISSVLISGQDLFRVRIGPLNGINAADKMLESVAQAGYSSAKIIVE
ncbi:MAG: hypothetical protein CMF69_01950 [Magnetovibrio sp.]|nr:hypothetical protein [Magnetovibrio sp.]|tara:strand:+ start:485 stop:1459 length:975 start_codon:yes stop_codon:yes gene_type:complete